MMLMIANDINTNWICRYISLTVAVNYYFSFSINLYLSFSIRNIEQISKRKIIELFHFEINV